MSDLKAIFTKLSTMPNNLLDTKTEDMSKYKLIWAPPSWIGGELKEKNKAMWTDGTRTSPVFPLFGVIDGRKSKLDDYGNCFYEENSDVKPTRYALSKSKVTVAITYPKLPPKHADTAYANAVSNQIYCLDAIQDNAVAALTAAGEPEVSTTDWARFETSDDGTVGWLHASIGPVYQSKVKKVKGKDVKDRSLVSSTNSETVDKPDIIDDRLGFLAAIKKHNLKHNEQLPCYLPNGERIGRCPSELRRELYEGRWVRMDVELVMWNMKSEGKRIFQLQVVRLEVLPTPAASMDGVVFASLNPSDYVNQSALTAIEAGTSGAEGSTAKNKKSATGNVDEDEDTFSESSDKSKNKRTADKQRGGVPKK